MIPISLRLSRALSQTMTPSQLMLISATLGLLLMPVVVRAEDESFGAFQPRRVLPPRPPITDPPIFPADAAEVTLADNHLVLGVVVGGEPRAYPINMLTGPNREIINDTLGEIPIAATWCHLCHNTVVFDRRVNDEALTFAVSGKLWRRNLVMIDSETSSLWSHFLAKAMSGRLEGEKLKTIPSKLTSWGGWRHEHPNTTVLMLPYRVSHYDATFYRQPEKFVLGIVVHGHAHHTSFAVLKKTPLMNVRAQRTDLLITFDPDSTGAQVFERSLNGKTLTFTPRPDHRMQDDQTGTIWESRSGVAIEGPLKGKSLRQSVSMPAYASAWSEFHPESKALLSVNTSPDM